MTVKAVELLAIDAKRYARSPQQLGQVRIDHNSTVTVVREGQPGTASVEFRYTASYGAAGIITIEGNLLWEGTPAYDAGKLVEQWRQSAQMPPDVASEIHSIVMRVCLPEAVGIAKNLQLPPPIPIPQVRFDQAKPGAPAQGKHAGGGMEVV
jgi:hypothetical protein